VDFAEAAMSGAQLCDRCSQKIVLIAFFIAFSAVPDYLDFLRRSNFFAKRLSLSQAYAAESCGSERRFPRRGR
jgi:hypothetical protein